VSDPIEAAKAEIERRNQQRRQTMQIDFRAVIAAEIIADQLTLIHAEMSVMRETLARISAKIERNL
jgi:hypothetical protein